MQWWLTLEVRIHNSQFFSLRVNPTTTVISNSGDHHTVGLFSRVTALHDNVADVGQFEQTVT